MKIISTKYLHKIQGIKCTNITTMVKQGTKN